MKITVDAEAPHPKTEIEYPFISCWGDEYYLAMSNGYCYLNGDNTFYLYCDENIGAVRSGGPIPYSGIYSGSVSRQVLEANRLLGVSTVTFEP